MSAIWLNITIVVGGLALMAYFLYLLLIFFDRKNRNHLRVLFDQHPGITATISDAGPMHRCSTWEGHFFERPFSGQMYAVGEARNIKFHTEFSIEHGVDCGAFKLWVAWVWSLVDEETTEGLQRIYASQLLDQQCAWTNSPNRAQALLELYDTLLPPEVSTSWGEWVSITPTHLTLKLSGQTRSQEQLLYVEQVLNMLEFLLKALEKEYA